MAKAINGFWLTHIDEPRGVEILKPEHEVEEESVEKADIVCNSDFESPI